MGKKRLALDAIGIKVKKILGKAGIKKIAEDNGHDLDYAYLVIRKRRTDIELMNKLIHAANQLSDENVVLKKTLSTKPTPQE